ncbi:hypothetical protein HMI56_004871 [Coelomomyces lativittatus]|nr:hypothetical protein HMI56_004871 [Coelomomyces lativittatus]
MGFMQLFSLLYLAADLESKSSDELKRFIMNTDQMELIQELKTIIEEYKAKNVFLANAYAAQKEISLSLVQNLEKSNTKLLKNQIEVDNFIKEGSQGLLKNFEIKLETNSIHLVNLISLKLNWLNLAELNTEMEFTLKNHSRKKTKFVTHGLKTNYVKTDNFEACILPFIGDTTFLGSESDDEETDNESSQSISAYVIKQKGSLPMEELWPTVFKELNTSSLKRRTVYLRMPRFRVREEIRLTDIHLPHVLRQESIEDFNSFMIPKNLLHLYEIKIQQNSEMCVDENGVTAASGTQGTLRDRSGIHLEFIIQSTFIFVVADRKNGFPLFVAEVDNILLPNESC